MAQLSRRVSNPGLGASPKPVKFFVPRCKPSGYAAAYDAMIAEIKHQFSWNVNSRQIYSLTYSQERKQVRATVGEIEQLERHYHVAAIFESTLYIIVTKSATGAPGPTILVGNQEVVETVDFKSTLIAPTVVLPATN